MKIPYQLHLTFELEAGKTRAFGDACVELGGKATLIELPRGHFTAQPMFTKVVHAANLEEARAAAREILDAFAARPGFHARREKIEVSIEYAPEAIDISDTYFEWHGKIVYKNGETLTALCERHGAHISRNAVKGEEANRFVTLRDCSKGRFNARLTSLIDALHYGGWNILKSKKEYCVFDSKPACDGGWLADTGERLPHMLACEAFIRRAAQIGGPFMLKGSYVGRHYFPSIDQRLPGDLDWVYLEHLDDVDEAHRIFGEWALAVTGLQLEDGVSFISFSENAFWRNVDYAMADDFPTTSTDVSCWVGGRRVDFSFDLSFNLDLPMEPVPLTFLPTKGESFPVPKTAPLALQVAWKLHQTVVRPRMKDFYDLAHFFIHPAFDATARTEALQAFVDECHADGVSPAGLYHFTHGNWEMLFQPDGLFRIGERKAKAAFMRWTKENLYEWNNELPVARSSQRDSSTSSLVEFENFKSFVLDACKEAGVAQFSQKELLALKPREGSWPRLRKPTQDKTV